jgi:recombination associated protein RdgC
MGLRKGTLTFARYRVIGRLPDRFNDLVSEHLRRNAFAERWRIADEKAAGWIALDDPLDSEFPCASYAQGRYLLFSLRVDRKTVAPSLLRLKVLEAERDKRKETGQKRLYREQREAIREAVRLDLLGKTLPVPSFYEVCWSVTSGTLLFGCLSDKVFEELQALFRDTFQLALCPAVPWEAIPAAEGQAASRQQSGASSATDPGSLLPSGADPLTIGREFLTWLWFKSEERGGKIRLPDAGDIEVGFTRRLVLESGNGEYAETVVCHGLHADLKEGKEALRQGKRISTARLRITLDQVEWEFTFKADRFHFQSLKLPTITEDAATEEIDREAQLLERIYLIEGAVQTMVGLFDAFLALRGSDHWEQEQTRMAKWVS